MDYSSAESAKPVYSRNKEIFYENNGYCQNFSESETDTSFLNLASSNSLILQKQVGKSKCDEFKKNCGCRRHLNNIRVKTSKKLLHSISNTTSTASKHIYLVLASRKKEKVYEIKTTKSCKVTKKTSNEKIVNEPYVDPIVLNDLNCLVEALIMNRKKKKDNRPLTDDETLPNQKATFELLDNIMMSSKCKCVSHATEAKSNKGNLSGQRSRVKITGSLGLNEEDKYVLKCAASINDEPIETILGKRNNYQFAPQRTSREKESKETQSTQVDFNLSYVNNEPRRECKNTQLFEKKDFGCNSVDTNRFLEVCYNPTNNQVKNSQVNKDLTMHKTNRTKESNHINQNKNDSQDYRDLKIGAHSNTSSTSILRKTIASSKNQAVMTRKSNILSNTNNIARSRSPSPKVVRGRDESIDKRSPNNRRTTAKLRSPSPKAVTSKKDNTNSRSSSLVRKDTRAKTPARKKSSSKTESIASQSPSLMQNIARLRSPSPTTINRSVYKIEHSPGPTRRSPKTSHAIPPASNIYSNKNKSRTHIESKTIKRPSKNPSYRSKAFSPNRGSILSSNEITGNDKKSKNLTNTSQMGKSPRNNNYPTSKGFEPHKSRINSPISRFVPENSKTIPQMDYDSRGTNTDRSIVKKMIIQDFTREMDNQRDNNKYISKRTDIVPNNMRATNAISKVSVKIDSDNEYYDLVFSNAPMTTDFIVRKTLKKRENKNTDISRKLPASMKEKPLSPNNKPLVVDNDSTNLNKVSIRDRIETSHRNEQSGTNYKIVNATAPHSKNKYYQTAVNHYTGDDCAIVDPSVRDKEIRKLLDVDDHQPIPYQKTTEIPLLDSMDTYYNREVRNLNVKEKVSMTLHTIWQRQGKNQNTSKQYKAVSTECHFQSVIVNKLLEKQPNNNLFKNKTITMSRKDYCRVKKSMLYKSKRSVDKIKTNFKKTSFVTVGEVRRTAKKPHTNIAQMLSLTKETQTDTYHIQRQNLDAADIRINSEMDPNAINVLRQMTNDCKNTVQVLYNTRDTKLRKNGRRKTVRERVSMLKIRHSNYNIMDHKMFRMSNTVNDLGSLKDIRTTCVSLKDVPPEGNSLRTIFKGPRQRSVTPNLGTSVDSLLAEDGTNYTVIESQSRCKAKSDKQAKPFLRRLVSCLALKTQKKSVMKTINQRSVSAVTSTFDSYNINTSLAGMEMSSSIYDTSISFYTDHGIFPINSKIKKSFFGSVKSFFFK